MYIDRKGIYQDFDANGNILTDERWQAKTLPDGSIYVENETVRVAPFDEPRSDSVTMVFGSDLRLVEFTIHGLFGQRESRICVLGEDRAAATLCWRNRGDVHERRIAWRDDFEIDFASPLFNMATVWRSKLQAGQARSFDAWLLDPVSFEPSLMRQTYANAGRQTRTTRFGQRDLWRYEIDFGGKSQSTFWCDDDGVLFDFKSPAGGFRLTAADLEL